MRVELRACWYQEYIRGVPMMWHGGLFHHWGTEQGDGGNFTIGIVEDEKTGAIFTLLPERIRFGNEPETGT